MIADFRSDTVTKPTRGMLEAMNAAPVGDDVFGEDPGVNALERKVAEMFGKQAAVFCPSGTMTNQIAIKAHTRPADEVICDRLSHVYNYEGGGIAFHSGCSLSLMDGDRGRFTAEDVANSIRPDDIHSPRTSLVAVENTTNKGGGACWDFAELQKIRRVCDENGLAFHLDGARLFNALVAKGETPEMYGNLFDSISICLSKGLGAPVGSLLLGDAEFIEYARRIRKLMGGGMRQAGSLAVAGIYALDNHVERLGDDHARAKRLAEVLSNLAYVSKVIEPETNIVIFELKKSLDPKAFLSGLEKEGVKAVSFGGQLIRFVTHLDITEQMMEHTIEKLSAISL
ncbi:threonine aldolase [Fulvitalea axinellae]|uniref:Threonine aldolase n=1 Tax=Fulvitalea axinellae TaxID=1182444 RepID=A0AAU9CR41_9BACT|nr:threonine aldolase [Fulvitalea axinellae]